MDEDELKRRLAKMILDFADNVVDGSRLLSALARTVSAAFGYNVVLNINSQFLTVSLSDKKEV